MKNKMNWMALLAALLLLPALALAVTEGVIEDAPAVDLNAPQDAAEVSYLPDASYYAGYGDWKVSWDALETHFAQEPDEDGYFHEVTQMPCLTSGEIIRARKLMTAYAAGEAAYEGEPLLGKTEDVIIGVYALDPAQYDGESVFHILPGTSLRDEELLGVIDAYAQMGKTFDPENLTYRNCMRGGGIESTRFYTEEERERNSEMANLIRRGLLKPEPDGETGVVTVTLNMGYFNGLDSFTLRPYRRMTDEEMIAVLVSNGVHDETAEIDFEGIEREARAQLSARLGLPKSMKLSYISDWTYMPQRYTETGEVEEIWEDNAMPSRTAKGAHLEYTNENGNQVFVYAVFDGETGEMVNLFVTENREIGNDEAWDLSKMEITDAQAVEAAKTVEARLGLNAMTWYPQERDTWTNWGPCRIVRAQVAEGEWMTVYIGQDDAKVHGLEISAGPAVAE